MQKAVWEKKKINEYSSTFLNFAKPIEWMLISCPIGWFGKLFQSFMILTKKEYFRESTFADFVWILYELCRSLSLTEVANIGET